MGLRVVGDEGRVEDCLPHRADLVVERVWLKEVGVAAGLRDEKEVVVDFAPEVGGRV